MSSQGPNSGSASDYGSGNPGGSFGGGNVAWTSVGDMDGSSAFATCAMTALLPNTHVAEVIGFGFSVPSGATINGIVVTFTGKDSSGAHQGTLYAQLLKGGSPTGTAKTLTLSTSSAGETLGSSSDLWGGSFGVSDINGSTFGVGLQEQGAAGSDTLSLQNVQITVYYTGGSSVPSAPTGLSVTNAASPVATWTNPSGTLTDNKLQYSTDNATWSTVDLGSVETSYAITGLEPDTLFYVQVAAVNSSGTGAYSTFAVCFTGTPLTLTVTLEPDGDAVTTGWAKSGGAASFSAALSDGSDSTYATPPASAGELLTLALTAPPANLLWATSLVINGRMKTASGSDTSPLGVQIFSGTGWETGTEFVNGSVTATLTTSFANYATANVAGVGGYVYNLAAFTGAQLSLNAPDTNQDALIAEVSVTLEYWSAPGGLLPEERQGAVPGSGLAIQGFRFVYRTLRRLLWAAWPFWLTLRDEHGGGTDAAAPRATQLA